MALIVVNATSDLEQAGEPVGDRAHCVQNCCASLIVEVSIGSAGALLAYLRC